MIDPLTLVTQLEGPGSKETNGISLVLRLAVHHPCLTVPSIPEPEDLRRSTPKL